MKFKLLGGGLIEAQSNQQLVERLNISSFFGYRESLYEYMQDTASACKLYNGAEIDYSDFDTFINGLIINGFLTEMSDA